MFSRVCFSLFLRVHLLFYALQMTRVGKISLSVSKILDGSRHLSWVGPTLRLPWHCNHLMLCLVIQKYKIMELEILSKPDNKTANTNVNKKALLSQRWPRNAPYTWVPWKLSGLPDYAHGYYSQHFSWAFVLIHHINVPSKFEVRRFTSSWNNRGYPKNLSSPWICPRSLFSKIFNGLYSDWSCKCTRQIWSP